MIGLHHLNGDVKEVYILTLCMSQWINIHVYLMNISVWQNFLSLTKNCIFTREDINFKNHCPYPPSCRNNFTFISREGL